MKGTFQHASKSFKLRNPHLFVGGLQTEIAKPIAPSSLDGRPQKFKKSKGGMVVRITLIVCRKRLTDDDNNVSSLKNLRDAISNSMGIDDADSRITFECAQVETKGREGVIVKIETI